MSKKIIIAGANGGFGKLTAISLLQRGHQVVATARDLQGRNKEISEELAAAGAIMIEMDVTNTESVNLGVQKAIEHIAFFKGNKEVL